MKSFLDRLERWIVYVIVILLFAMVFLLAAQIFIRNVMSSSIFWSDEVARYMLIWMSLLGAALGIRHLSHVNMDFFANLLPPKARTALAIVVDVLILGFVLVFMYRSFFYAIDEFFTRSTSAKVPMGIPYLALPVGGALMIMFLAEKMAKEFRRLTGRGGGESGNDSLTFDEGTGI